MKNYEAILIDTTISSGRVSGVLTIYSDRVEFLSDSKTIEISNTFLKITAGGAGNRLIFFSDCNINDLSIYTDDKKVLKNEFLINNHLLAGQLKSSKKVVRKIIFSSIYVLSFFILLILGAYLAKDYFVEKLANQVPREWEKKAGDQLFKTISGQYKIVENDSLKKVFLEVAKPLLNQIEKKGVKIELYFVEDPSINAFALPGGKVIIQSGLLENSKSWEEVLGVLSHELAHVTRRHHIRGIINNMGLYVILSTLIGDVTALAGTIGNLGGELASLSNSRAFETEADETGWGYLVKGHINPKGMISFFETLDKKHGTKMDGYLAFMSTHPETKNRIKNLKAKLKESSVNFKLIGNDFVSFKNSFKSKM